MTKTAVHQIRLTDAEKTQFQETTVQGGWKSMADMIRSLVSQAAEKQSQAHPQPTAQRQPDHHDGEPQL